MTMNENDKQAEPVVFPGDALRWTLNECKATQTDNGVFFPESELAKLALILARSYADQSLAQKTKPPVFDNDAAWDLAQKVRTDLDRKSCPGAFMDLAMESINRHYTHPAQPVQPAGAQGEPVAEVTAKMMLDQEWRIYAYKVGQLMVGTKLYAKAPAVAVNEQLLDCLEVAFHGLSWYHENYPESVEECDHEALQQIEAAIAAAEAEKAKGGV